MATIVTVHGTFAHIEGAPGTPIEPQWWQRESKFIAQARELIQGKDGVVEVLPFEWSGNNSELERRDAADRLLKLLRALDERNEAYCVIGHSHGGSIISTALVESVAFGKPLKGLKRWITVGTPFIGMRKEPFLFTRLNLVQRTLFVASLMLLMMFAFFVVGQMLGPETEAPRRAYSVAEVGFAALLMSLPFIVFYSILRFLDRRTLYLYRSKWIKKAREAYGPSWLQLCHSADEAVQGLRALPKVNPDIVERGFATSTLAMGAIFSLPLIYLFVVTSPGIMLWIGDFLKTNVYSTEAFKPEDPLVKRTEDLDKLMKRMREARRVAEGGGLDAGKALDARQELETLRPKIKELRTELSKDFPDFGEFERGRRFSRRFFMQNGQPCANGQLCGGGEDFSVNTRLLFYLATDELTNAIVSDGLELGPANGAIRLLVPILLVPLFSGIVAVVIMMIVEALAHQISALAAWWLNRTTLAEIKRSAYGNDTEGEIATGADRYPFWAGSPMPYLPDELADLIAAFSNTMTADTLAKFRKAISSLVFSDGEAKSGAISAYFTWKELVHATYFDVPEFRKLVLHAMSRADGFEPAPQFLADPDYGRTGAWLSQIEQRVAAAEEGPGTKAAA